jgi:hypothetical protein
MPKTYGALVHDASRKRYVITQCEPHVSIKLKNIFPRIPKGAVPPFSFPDTPQNSADLLWFSSRYHLRIDEADRQVLAAQAQAYEDNINELEAILTPHYQAPAITLNPGYAARPYQLQFPPLHARQKRLLLGDDLGLGKSLSATLTLFTPGTLPVAIVVQTHMTRQWKEEVIEKFTNLTVHIIKKTTPYTLPKADVYIFKYTQLAGWSVFFKTNFFRSAIFDEIQELRNYTSAKYAGGKCLSTSVEYTCALSATPIFNYGDEMFNVLDLINPDCLDTRDNFLREWCVPYGRNHKVVDPKALGTFLRENHLFLRRTRQEVGRELPAINTIIHYVEYDEKEVKKSEQRARELAQRVTTGSFIERGQAAQELDMLARYTTGISKARAIADYVRILLEADEPVVLGLWHRDCFGKGTKVLAFDGSFLNVENVKAGDLLMGPDSKPRKVRSSFLGVGDMFRIIPKKGEPWVCSSGHILTLHKNKSGYKTMTARDFYSLNPSQQKSYTLYRADALVYPEQESVVEPWLLGFWLGDGASDLRTMRLCSADVEIRDELELIANRWSLSVKATKTINGDSCYFYDLTSGATGVKTRNKLVRHFRSLSLADNKHIPHCYQTASLTERWELLSGLIDSDGHVYRNAMGADFVNKSKKLAEDVTRLCKSLGLAAYLKTYTRTTPYDNTAQVYHTVRISGDLTALTVRVKRKKPDVRRQIKSVLRTGLRIEPIGVDTYYGFETDGDHLFLLDDLTVVHNCYDIVRKELAEYNPVMYSGTESEKQKHDAKTAFIEGRTKLFLISLRSGAGLDGLQKICKTIVIGELDWSPQVHDQLVGRIDRDGQVDQVMAIYLVSESGSDPVIINLLGLKSSQSHGIVDPLKEAADQYSDESRMQALAKHYLSKHA